MDFLKAIISPSYWFSHQNPVPEAWLYSLAILFGVLLLIGIVCTLLASMKKFQKPYRNVFYRVAVWGWTMGLFGYVLLFFSVERVWLISARAMYLAWLALAIYWIYFPVKYFIKDVPRLLAYAEEQGKKDKYLPRRKK